MPPVRGVSGRSKGDSLLAVLACKRLVASAGQDDCRQRRHSGKPAMVAVGPGPVTTGQENRSYTCTGSKSISAATGLECSGAVGSVLDGRAAQGFTRSEDSGTNPSMDEDSSV